MKPVTVIVMMLAFSGCSTKPNVIKHQEPFTVSGTHRIYVVSHGWHTGFVLPSKQIVERIPALYQRFGQTPHIEFGWGDRGFYQAKEITTGLTLQAIFLPTESVIHAVAVPTPVKAYFQNSEIIHLCLNDDELSSLVSFVSGSFATDKRGNVIPLKRGIYGDSQFYQGVGDYYLMNTCNKWTANGLKSIGMDISPLFKPRIQL